MAKRQSINSPTPRHENPIPNASRIGNVVMSSVIGGLPPPAPVTLPPTLDEPARKCLRRDQGRRGSRRRNGRRHSEGHLLCQRPDQGPAGDQQPLGQDVPRPGGTAGSPLANAAARQQGAGAGRLHRSSVLTKATAIEESGVAATELNGPANGVARPACPVRHRAGAWQVRPRRIVQQRGGGPPALLPVMPLSQHTR